MFPRRFALIRHVDYTGVSGVGVVAYGVSFTDGQVVLRWLSEHPSTSTWNSIDDMIAVYGTEQATDVQWIDHPTELLDELTGKGDERRNRHVSRAQPPAPSADPDRQLGRVEHSARATQPAPKQRTESTQPMAPPPPREPQSPSEANRTSPPTSPAQHSSPHNANGQPPSPGVVTSNLLPQPQRSDSKETWRRRPGRHRRATQHPESDDQSTNDGGGAP